LKNGERKMGFFNIFKKGKPESKVTSGQKSSAPRPTTKQKIVVGAFKVAKATKKQVKKTAGNVKANVVYAWNYKERVFPIERKGFKKLGTYKPDSWDLKWTIARYQRKGYTLATVKAKNGYGEPVIVLFAKHGKVATRTRKTVKAPAKRNVTKSKAVAVRGRSRAPAKKKVTKSKAVAVRGRSRAPETLTIDGMRFQKGGTFGNNREDAMNFAKRLKKDHGFKTRMKKINIYGEPVYAVYFRKDVKKAKRYY
jgi:hypothetical protein